MAGRTGLFVQPDGSSNGTTPAGARLALAGLLATDGAGGAVPGVMWDGRGPVVSGAASMKYVVRSCVVVLQSSAADGVIVAANDAALDVPTTAAPASNSRIDVIWARQHRVVGDGPGADTDTVLEFGCTQGAAAAVPAAPAIPVGAMEVAQAVVPAGTTATNTLALTQKDAWTWSRPPRPPKVDVFTVSGTWVKPVGARVVRVRCVGGGGGGGTGAGAASGQGQGAGGGGGGYVEKLYAADDLLASQSVTVGVGGSGASGDGDPGGASTFAGMTAGGGAGGVFMTATSGAGAATGGPGGTASGGDVNIPGGDGGPGRVLAGASTLTGHGGGNVLSGQVASGLSAAVPGADGKAGGGGGAGAFVATVSRAGGNGAPGVVIVETWY